MRNISNISIRGKVTVDQLDQRYVMTPREARDGYLVRTLQVLRDKKAAKGLAIVFVRTVKECEVLAISCAIITLVTVICPNEIMSSAMLTFPS